MDFTQPGLLILQGRRQCKYSLLSLGQAGTSWRAEVFFGQKEYVLTGQEGPNWIPSSVMSYPIPPQGLASLLGLCGEPIFVDPKGSQGRPVGPFSLVSAHVWWPASLQPTA